MTLGLNDKVRAMRCLRSAVLACFARSRQATIARGDRYLVKRNIDGEYVASTNDLGAVLPSGFCLVDTIGEDGLGTVNGNRGIPAFLRAKRRGKQP